MALSIVKELAVVEDIEFGTGTVTQSRPNVEGVLTPTVYNRVNASHIPMADGILTIEDRVVDTYSKNENDAQLALKADKTNVLEKDNVAVYTPTSSYNPATMKYVQETLIGIGEGSIDSSGPNYIRFVDGTQLCFDRIDTDAAANTTSNSFGTTSGDINYINGVGSFPQDFNSGNEVFITLTPAVGGTGIIGINPLVQNTNADTFSYTISSTDDEVLAFYYIAIGQWK